MSILGSTSVIFDLDGTLVNSEPNYYEASRRTLAEHGVTGFSWADHERYVGISTRETVVSWTERYGLDAPVEAVLADKNRHYLELAHAGTEAYDWIVASRRGASWRSPVRRWCRWTGLRYLLLVSDQDAVAPPMPRARRWRIQPVTVSAAAEAGHAVVERLHQG